MISCIPTFAFTLFHDFDSRKLLQFEDLLAQMMGGRSGCKSYPVVQESLNVLMDRPRTVLAEASNDSEDSRDP